MSKFKQNLVASNSDIKQIRAEAITTQAERAKKRIYENLEDRLINVQTEKVKLNDLSPTSTTDLTYREDFNAEEWAARLHELDLLEHSLKLEMEIALKSYEEWFGPINGKSEE